MALLELFLTQVFGPGPDDVPERQVADDRLVVSPRPPLDRGPDLSIQNRPSRQIQSRQLIPEIIRHDDGLALTGPKLNRLVGDQDASEAIEIYVREPSSRTLLS